MWERHLSVSIHDSNADFNITSITLTNIPSNMTPADESETSPQKVSPQFEEPQSPGGEISLNDVKDDPVPAADPQSNPSALRQGTTVKDQVQRYRFLVQTEIPKRKATLATQDPQSYKKEMEIMNKNDWLTAIEKEMQSLYQI